MLKDFYERKKLEKLLKNNTIMGDFSDFTKYSPTYLATNENHRNVLKVVDVKDKDILCVTSSGDFVFNSLASGARSVVTFDLNKFAKYVLELKVATVKTYNDEKLYAGFWLNNSPYFLSFNKFLEIRGNLSSDAFLFWNYVYSYLDIHKLSLGKTDFFRNTMYNIISIQEEYNVYYEKNYYEKLREKLLKGVCISCYDMDITAIKSLESKYQFDVIYLSNILQYYATIDKLDSKEKVHKFIQDIEEKLLRPNGLISVNYCYFRDLIEFINEVSPDIRDISNYLVLKYPSEYELINFSGILTELEDGLCLKKKLV